MIPLSILSSIGDLEAILALGRSDENGRPMFYYKVYKYAKWQRNYMLVVCLTAPPKML